MALYAILRAMGIGVGDEVIVPGFTCLAVPMPIILLGAKPVYVDIDQGSYNLDTNKLERSITPRTKAVIAQHTFGIPVEMQKLMRIANKYNLRIIEDCCHSLTSRIDGQKIGTFGDASFLSYEWGKPVVIGTGGSATINTQQLLETIKQIYQDSNKPSAIDVTKIRMQYVVHAICRRPALFWKIRQLYHLFVTLNIGVGAFSKSELEGKLNYFSCMRMSDYHQKKLSQKLTRIDNDTVFRLGLVADYEERLDKMGVKTVSVIGGRDISYLRYPLLVRNKPYVLDQARRRSIELGNWFSSPVHPWPEKYWASALYKKGTCPVGEFVSARIITLPVYNRISKKDIDKTFEFFNQMTQEGELR